MQQPKQLPQRSSIINIIIDRHVHRRMAPRPALGSGPSRTNNSYMCKWPQFIYFLALKDVLQSKYGHVCSDFFPRKQFTKWSTWEDQQIEAKSVKVKKRGPYSSINQVAAI